MAETSYALPVYRGWPERPYRVLGSLSLPDQNAAWNNGDIALAAKSARAKGGDAIVIRQGAEYGVSRIAGARQDSMVLSAPNVTTALVVKWLTEDELREIDRLLDEYLKAFSANHPSVAAANRTVGELTIVLLVQSGLDLRSQELRDRFHEEMTRLVATTPESLAGRWIFKASLSVSAITSGWDDKNHLGTATVTVEGESVAIVSDGGGIELNFAGSLSKGRLSGQVGLGSVSSKCEGAATPEKISLNFSSRSAEGTVRGNVILQRLIPQSNEYEKTDPRPARGV